MDRNFENGEQRDKASFWKKAGIWLVSLKWVNWVKRADWLRRNLFPLFFTCISGWLSEWVELEQVNGIFTSIT